MANFDPGIAHGTSLVLDTSVVINLYASGHGEKVVAALPFRLVVAGIVSDELDRQSSRSSGERNFLAQACNLGLIELIEMTDEEYQMFTNLVVVAPSLDDGEAATIAIARSRNFVPVIDERKGRARALALIKQSPAWSLNLIRHPTVVCELGERIATEALHNALRVGRMRIAPDHTDQVISVIGLEKARKCTCLPGYKERFQVLPVQ
ncbi:MAG: DNA-binding protein [Sphingobium sp.]|nr:MAG: DNA-binding protein [Sphingobium sp.]